MADDNHTPIPHLINQNDPNASVVQTNLKKHEDKKTAPVTTSAGGKESEPIRQESEFLKSAEDTKDIEDTTEEEKENNSIKVVKQIPKISKDAASVGVAVAPSAKPFPTIYDVKVPIYTDEQIEQNLHKSFWTGARWLAELCKYLLWQSHIKLKKVGNRIIRQTA